MSKDYYKNNNMLNISLWVTIEMKEQVKMRAKTSHLSLRETYASIFEEFIQKVEKVGVDKIDFSAPFKKLYEKNNTQFWVSEEQGEKIKQVANKANVTVRDFCFTALEHTLQQNLDVKKP